MKEEEGENVLPSTKLGNVDDIGERDFSEGISSKVENFYLALRYGTTLTIESQHYYELVDAICDLEDHEVIIEFGETADVVRVK